MLIKSLFAKFSLFFVVLTLTSNPAKSEIVYKIPVSAKMTCNMCDENIYSMIETKQPKKITDSDAECIQCIHNFVSYMSHRENSSSIKYDPVINRCKSILNECDIYAGFDIISRGSRISTNPTLVEEQKKLELEKERQQKYKKRNYMPKQSTNNRQNNNQYHYQQNYSRNQTSLGKSKQVKNDLNHGLLLAGIAFLGASAVSFVANRNIEDKTDPMLTTTAYLTYLCLGAGGILTVTSF